MELHAGLRRRRQRCSPFIDPASSHMALMCSVIGLYASNHELHHVSAGHPIRLRGARGLVGRTACSTMVEPRVHQSSCRARLRPDSGRGGTGRRPHRAPRRPTDRCDPVFTVRRLPRVPGRVVAATERSRRCGQYRLPDRRPRNHRARWGTAMLSGFTAHVWATDPQASCIIVPVCSANHRSWRALLSAGFRLVASGDLKPDNPVDGPLHEILRIDRPLQSPDADRTG